MAVSTTLRDSSRPDEPAPLAKLLNHAVGLLLDHVSDPRAAPGSWRFGPLVIVSATEGIAATAVATAAASRGAPLAAADVATWQGEALGREIASALADDRLDRFAAALAAVRLVIVDRIDRVAGDDVQASFAHLFDAATAAGTAWCVSVAEMPANGLDPRCASRLGAGLVVPAPTPVPAAHAAGFAPSLGRVIRVAARHHDLPVDAVLGPARRRTVAAARSLAMYLARRVTAHSLQAIGDACGGRDHTTVLHGVRACGARIARDHAFAADVDRLTAELASAARSAGAGRRRSGVGSATLGRTLASRRRGRRRQA